MYRRILIPVDGSPCGGHTVSWALSFAEAVGAEVTFLHVLENLPLSMYTLPGGALYRAELMPELERAGKVLLENAQAEAEALGVTLETLIVKAEHPARAILQREADHDLTIMGTHSRRGLDRLFLGSVTEGVLRRSEKPQLVVRCPTEDAPRGTQEARFGRILLPIDGSPCSARATDEGLQLARALGAQVTFLHALEVPVSAYTMPESMVHEPQLREDFKGAAQSALDEARAHATELGVETTTELVDHPGVRATEAILEHEGDVDLSVMGTHGRRGVNRVLLGSVTEGVIRQSAVPHLVVRCPGQR